MIQGWLRRLLTYQYCIAASSQMISWTHCSMIACLEFLFMLHTESSQSPSTEIKNVECAVWPPGSRRATIPDDATQRTICPSVRMRWHSVLYTKVLPDPAGPLRKNIQVDWSQTDSRMDSYADSYSSLSLLRWALASLSSFGLSYVSCLERKGLSST